MTEEIKFPSEQSGMPIVKESPSIVGNMPFHTHSGTDGSPKISALNAVNTASLEGGKFNDDVASANFNTSSATYVDVTGATLTISQTVNEKRYLLLMTCVIYHSTGISGSYLTFSVDGIQVGTEFFHQNQDVSEFIPVTIHYVTEILAAGSHTFTLQVKTNAATFYVWTPRLTIIELT